MPGVFEVRSVAPVGRAIDDLILLAECSVEGNGRDRCASCLCEIPEPKVVLLIVCEHHGLENGASR
jgi:hypothetical protein